MITFENQTPASALTVTKKELQARRIVIIDDDAELCRLLARVFTGAGARVDTTTSAWTGLQLIAVHDPDLIILDVMMPELDGWEALRLIRLHTRVPVIMLSARVGTQDVIRGLDLGAADYVTKPFSPELLLARARTVLRSHAPGPTRPAAPVIYSDDHLSIDLFQRLVHVRGRRVRLSQTEFRLLAFLMRHVGRVVSMEHIMDAIWGDKDAVSSANVHVFMSRLRQKLEQDPGRPEYLLTHHGRGYRLRLPERA